MKTFLSAFVAVFASAFLSGVAFAGNLILVGDSTLAPRKPEAKIGSWGDSMSGRLADGWSIFNVAVGGKTVRTIQQGKKISSWQKALDKMAAGDFVIVQFGINDANPKKLVEVPDFKSELGKFVDLIRAKGATPVLCSPIASCDFSKTAQFVRNKNRDKYAAATKEVAEEKKVDYVDMTTLTGNVLAAIGQETSETYYVGPTERDGKPIVDHCHPSKTGAKAFGEAFVKDVVARKLPIAAIFK